MPLVQRLRRWLAVIAILFSLFVAGVYVRGRLRQNIKARVLPAKIDAQIKRTANGFEYSKSEGGRTIFTIRAGEVKEFKLNGYTALRKVSIILYGRDSSRFDRIYGDDFAYDPQSGNVTANGQVQIDLEANPAGMLNADQTPPAEMKSPIHLKAGALVFNRNSGNAVANGRVEFTSEQASGWADGVRYQASNRTLMLVSDVHILLAGPNASVLTAARGTVSGEPRQLRLEQPHLQRGVELLQAAAATLFFTPGGHVDRIVAENDVHAEAAQHERGSATALARSTITHSTIHAERAEFALNGTGHQLRSGLLIGHVRVDRTGEQPLQASADRVSMQFSGSGVLQRVRAEQQARIHFGATDGSTVKPATTGAGSGNGEGNYEITAQAIDFDVAGGSRLERATTSGPAQITLLNQRTASQPKAAPPTVITAGRFEANFDHSAQGRTRLASVHGEPDAKIVSQTAGQPQRVSTSRSVAAEFSPDGQLVSVTQQGDFQYFSGGDAARQMHAFSDAARYTTADQIAVLSGNPRLTGQNMTTTAQKVDINRSTGEALAQGDVKSTYISQPASQKPSTHSGGLLGSTGPIHVTAAAMKARSNPNLATYTGQPVRLWQGSNMIEAPEIQFDGPRRTVVATGNSNFSATTTLAQSDKAGKSTSVKLAGGKLTYTEADRVALYEGGVTAHGQDFTATSTTMSIYLSPANQVKENTMVTGSNRVERILANGAVNLEQAGRKATGEHLVYTPSDEKFVLTGGPPSIFDAERGKITGDSLTFYRRDARVLVEGEANSPVVTQTRVAR